MIALMLAACGGDDQQGDDGPADCADLEGSWEISGACGADLCTISQSGCAITQVDCTSGAHSTSGDIDGDNFTYTGVSGGGLPATCSGAVTAGGISGTCTTEGLGNCSFSGDRP